MKKLNLLLTIILGITILSCSSDDENSSGNDSDLIGTWYGVSSTFNGNNSGIPDNSILKFTTDNRVEFIYEGFGNNGEDISEFGDWLENGNTLTITFDEADAGLENYVLEILELNDTTLKWRTEIVGEGTLIETFSKNQNATVDLSQFQDYNLEFTVDIAAFGPNEPYEFQATFLTTDGDDQVVEMTETYSGLTANTDDFISDSKIVKEYKVVGVRATAVSSNVGALQVKLTRVSNQNEIVNSFENIPNSATISYDFETGNETSTSN
ncbi:lipocalin family protein [Formosa sp. Hel1_31_208]|uniref:lipocalin family protein n=1 Tax=Formosa sp. Hel1_31_208 TaxID=1798225 RepID=UPI0012FD5208|nr:lipocalin family protein [Formosa sp. Hel1_31_208]